MVRVKSNSRVETELPLELRKAVNRLLLEPGTTYDEIARFVKSKGFDISRSSIGRYGQRFLEAYQKIKQFEDQARAITSGVDDGMPMEEAVGKLMLQKVMEALVDGSADITENSRLISDVAKLQSAHIQLAKWKADLERRASKAADAVGKIVKRGGLSDAAADAIRQKILGVVKR
jgi:hypothetical protein